VYSICLYLLFSFSFNVKGLRISHLESEIDLRPLFILIVLSCFFFLINDKLLIQFRITR
jgi:hypothetical protein